MERKKRNIKVVIIIEDDLTRVPYEILNKTIHFRVSFPFTICDIDKFIIYHGNKIKAHASINQQVAYSVDTFFHIHRHYRQNLLVAHDYSASPTKLGHFWLALNFLFRGITLLRNSTTLTECWKKLSINPSVSSKVKEERETKKKKINSWSDSRLRFFSGSRGVERKVCQKMTGGEGIENSRAWNFKRWLAIAPSLCAHVCVCVCIHKADVLGSFDGAASALPSTPASCSHSLRLSLCRKFAVGKFRILS